MEKALVMWMEDMSQKRVAIDGNVIKQTAIRLYNKIKEKGPGTSSRVDKKFEFSASTGWMTEFLKRYAFHNIKIKGETVSADESEARKFPQKLAKIIEDG